MAQESTTEPDDRTTESDGATTKPDETTTTSHKSTAKPSQTDGTTIKPDATTASADKSAAKPDRTTTNPDETNTCVEYRCNPNSVLLGEELDHSYRSTIAQCATWCHQQPGCR